MRTRRFSPADVAAIAGALLVVAAMAYIVDRALVPANDREDFLAVAVAALAGLAAMTIAWLRARVDGGDTAVRVRDRIEDVRRLERAWSRELRRRVLELYRQRGWLAADDDLGELILRVAVDLLEARKGLLLARNPASGVLEVGGRIGFEHDPVPSALARRFAQEVIDRDATVRVDPWEAGEDATPADEEIENLVAIPLYVRDEFDGVVIAANKPGGFGKDDDEVLLSLGDHAGALLERSQLHGELRRSYLATVRLLADAIEVKDPGLRYHSEDVSRYALAVADRLGMEPARRETVLFGSLLHDVGKIGISELILLKPGVLTDEERGVINLHPRIGFRLVEQVPALAPIAQGILHHHERWDGDGYPGGLEGEEIPLEARIIAVVDSFSAMTQHRPYRGALSAEKACEELERCAGSQFDPDVVRAFVTEVRSASETAGDLDPLEAALDDPEVDELRDSGAPALPPGPLGLVDGLTMLYSRRHIQELAGAEARRANHREQGFGIVLGRLLELGAINQRDGYSAGDAALQTASEAFQAVALRAGGTAARWGGSRLALLVPGADSDATERLASELEAALGDGPAVRCRAAAWEPGESGEDVVARARRALG
jgi:HD-GYP domain-containing protein (c-di-GMP phosphodiesterase class II)/GGDEF domain-containing protein